MDRERIAETREDARKAALNESRARDWRRNIRDAAGSIVALLGIAAGVSWGLGEIFPGHRPGLWPVWTLLIGLYVTIRWALFDAMLQVRRNTNRGEQ